MKRLLLHTTLIAITATAAFMFVNQPTTALTANDYEEQVNIARAEQGLKPLQPSGKLRSTACLKAQGMLARDYWSHSTPDGSKFSKAIKDSGYRYSKVGENLSKNNHTAEATVDAWLDSQAHKDNLMGDYKEQGICTRSNATTEITVQHLGKQ